MQKKPDEALIARLKQLDRDELLDMYDAAADVTECLSALAEQGKNPVTEVLAGAEAVDEWAHFPQGDAIDRSTHSQFFYHAHAAEERASGEHGHFHTFVRPRALIPGLYPDNADDDADGEGPPPITHLVGISADSTGQLLRLFTTNRWVTGEEWHGADDALRLLDRFAVTGNEPSPLLNRWMTAVMRMYRPQIADLIRERDAVLARRQALYPDRDAFEDRELHIVSELPIDFLAQVRAIEAALDTAS